MFNKTITNIHKGIIFLETSIHNIDNCVILSANGSISFPKLVIKLNFLAIVPSNISVIPDKVRNIIANIN
jgi:hypothetical protein